MKFGIMLPHSGALAGVEAIRRVALEADDLGFDSVWCHDHVTYDTDWFLHRGSGLIEQCEGNRAPLLRVDKHIDLGRRNDAERQAGHGDTGAASAGPEGASSGKR